MLPFFDDFDFYLRLDSDSLCDRQMPDLFSQMEVTMWRMLSGGARTPVPCAAVVGYVCGSGSPRISSLFA